MNRCAPLRRAAAAIAAATTLAACSGASGTLPEPVPTPAAVVPAGAPSVGSEANTVPTTAVPRPPDEAPVALPDITAAPLDTERLASLLPAGVPAGVAGPTIATRSNAQLVAAGEPDHADERFDIERFGRIDGVAGRYLLTDGVAHIWIDLLPDADLAHEYLLDAAGDVAKEVGRLRIGAAEPDTVVGFPVEGIADEAIGLILTGVHTETAIMMRIGRIVAMASVVADGAERRVAAHYLAERTADGIVDALLRGTAAAPIAPPGGEPEAAEFSLELRAVAAGDTVLEITAVGTRLGHDVACRVRSLTPTGIIDRELRRIGDQTWARDAGDSWGLVGPGNVLDATLLGWCPAWPLELDTAGLSRITRGEAASLSTEQFGDTLGYAGSLDLLAESVGTALRGVELDLFTAWIARDGLLVGLNLELAGPAASLAPLVGSWPIADGWIELTIRHRVDAIGDAVAPPRPPA